MRSRMLLVVLLVAAMAVVASQAGASKSVHVKIPLPEQGHSRVALVTVKMTAPEGKTVGPLHVRTTNDARLPSEVRAVAGISPRSSRKRQATFKVYVFINRPNFADRAASAAAEPDGFINLAFNGYVADSLIAHIVGAQSCSELREKGLTDDSFLGRSKSTTKLREFTLDRLRKYSEQPSADEAVLDNAVYRMCAGAETPEDGSR